MFSRIKFQIINKINMKEILQSIKNSLMMGSKIKYGKCEGFLY
jgi:hypothetical protein